jgi:nitrate reductase gamma subunit
VLEFVEGPLWYAALTIFLAGTCWRLAGTLLLGRKRVPDPARGSPAIGALHSMVAYMLPRGPFFDRPKVLFVFLAGYAFHLGLFTLLLFGGPHVTFIKEHLLGVGWTPLPRWGFIIIAEISFLGLLMLWVRRAVDPVTRMISRIDDHVAAGLTMLVMLTGCFALGEQSDAMRTLHMFSVDVWLIYFPFGSLIHTFTWIFTRGFTGALFAKRGIRT